MPLSDQEKETIISHALATDAGRTALAQAMCEPIRESLDLFGMAGSIFQEPTREMALGALSRYEKNVANGKIFSDGIVSSINDIYDRWDVKRGHATSILNGYKVEKYGDIVSDPKKRFDILDL